MNERIKELVKQAGGHFSTHILTSYPAQRRESIELWDKNIEKFAELIVLECANIADTAEPFLSSDLIKQHFGVEESKGWVCPKCGTDRTKQECPKGYTAALTGDCPMVGTAQ